MLLVQNKKLTALNHFKIEITNLLFLAAHETRKTTHDHTSIKKIFSNKKKFVFFFEMAVLPQALHKNDAYDYFISKSS
jgi:hypothetical protein